MLTPAGVCVACAVATDPRPTVTPRSDPFWLLTPQEMARLEPEMHRLAAEAARLESTLSLSLDEPTDDDEICAEIDVIERERLVLHMLYAASLQFGPRV